MQPWFRYDGDRLIIATYDRRLPLADFSVEQRIRAANVWKPRELVVTLFLAVVFALTFLRAPLHLPLNRTLETALAFVLAFVFARGALSIVLSILEWIYGPTFSSIHPGTVVADDELGDDAPLPMMTAGRRVSNR